MTIKELAYSTQQHLQTATGAQFKRAHIYELLAASFGFNSYAALSSDAVFTKDSLTNRRTSKYVDHVKDRCLEIGYDTNTADVVAASLPRLLTEQEIGVIRIPDLIAHLRYEPGHGDWNEDEEEDDWELVEDERLAVTEALISPLLIDGLTNAAAKGNATAHFALALIHADDDIDDVETGSDYWYQQAQSGRVLAGVEKEWADSHEARLNREQLFARHLKEAARLGCPEALLELADRFDDPAFFEQATSDVNADPAWVAEIAERLGRREDSKKWLTEAAKCGDTEAMRQLIEEYDHGDPLQCWTWVYLAELVGKDLTKDEHYAINEDGSSYDDDVGGPAYVGGQEGVELIPISTEQSDAARRAAQLIFQEMKRMAG